MSEDSIKSAEERLHDLIMKSETVLRKLKRTLNGLIIVLVPIIIAFFWSFIDVQKTQTAMKAEKLSIKDAQEIYATKTSVIFFMNDVYDMNNMTFSYNQGMSEERLESIYAKASKRFRGDVSRGTDENK